MQRGQTIFFAKVTNATLHEQINEMLPQTDIILIDKPLHNPQSFFVEKPWYHLGFRAMRRQRPG
jgi:hypothetical protein